MKLDTSGCIIVLVMLIGFYFFGHKTGYNLGYQTATARIYQSINIKTYQSWISGMIRYEFEDFMSKQEARE